MSQGAEGQPPQTRAKPLFFGQKVNFRAEASKENGKFFLFIRQKTEFILSSEKKYLKSGIFTINYWVG